MIISGSSLCAITIKPVLEDSLVKEPATIFNKTWYTVVTSQEDDKNVMKRRSHHALFMVQSQQKNNLFGPFGNNLAQPETRKNKIHTIFFHDANIINRI